MAAGLVASLFANLIDKHSLYDHLKDRYLSDVYKDGVQQNVEEPEGNLDSTDEE
jgi:hypothetical protein